MDGVGRARAVLRLLPKAAPRARGGGAQARAA